ncbi:MAG: hypothetical protein HQK88_02340 [Nitrospirae bacterium]|nr:hypothetical protein [Nitrospirota bacterium]MBF0534381.1 hypothetical protein [Nitrospirota bacterium]MBF0615638.1 hypothetical protein [Nitrospirota bacterium]
MGKFVEQDITYTKEDIHRLIGIFGENVVHKMRKANLEAEIHEITKELDYYKERIERAELKNKETVKSLKEHDRLSTEMNGQIAHLTKEKEYLDREIEKFSNIEQKAAELIDRDAMIFNLKKEVSISEGKAKHLKQTHEKISAEKTRTENIVSETQKRFDELTAETAQLREILAFQKSVIPAFENMKELQRYKDEAQRATTEIQKAADTAIKEITKSAEILSARTVVRDKAEQGRINFTTKKEHLEQEIAEITGYETIEELQKAVAQLLSNKDSMTEAIAVLESTKAEEEEKIEQTELQIKQYSMVGSDYEKTVNEHNAKQEELRVFKEEVSLRELEIGVTERLTEFSVPIEEFLQLNHKALKSILDRYESCLLDIKNIFGELLQP